MLRISPAPAVRRHVDTARSGEAATSEYREVFAFWMEVAVCISSVKRTTDTDREPVGVKSAYCLGNPRHTSETRQWPLGRAELAPECCLEYQRGCKRGDR
jgi:hypothetical protein